MSFLFSCVAKDDAPGYINLAGLLLEKIVHLFLDSTFLLTSFSLFTGFITTLLLTMFGEPLLISILPKLFRMLIARIGPGSAGRRHLIAKVLVMDGVLEPPLLVEM